MVSTKKNETVFGRNSESAKGEKMISPTCVDSVMEYLRGLLGDSSFNSFAVEQYLELIRELGYLKIYMVCLAKWNDSSFGEDKNFGFVEEFHIEATLEEAERKIKESGFEGFDTVASGLLEKIQQCKPKIKEDCLNFLDCPIQCDFSTDELLGFMFSSSASLHNLLDLKGDLMFDVKVQIESLEGSLDLFKQIFEFTSKRCSSHEDLKDFKIHIQAWASRAACLSLLYWVLDLKEENIARRMDLVLSDLQKNISPSTPEIIRIYLAVLKASKPSSEDSLTVSKLVLKFVEFLQDNLQVDSEEDGIQMLFVNLIFFITFLMDRPEAEKFGGAKLILAEADAVVSEVASLISSLSSGEIIEGIAEGRNLLVQNFLEKASAIKAEVRKIYAHLFLSSSSFNFPRTNVLGFIDSILENLKDFCLHFPKHQILVLQKELMSLKESNLKVFSVPELQNKHKGLQDLWTRIVNVAYNAERAISSIIYMKKPLWHDILSLSDVIEELKLIKCGVKRIQVQHTYDIHASNSEMSSNPLLPLQANIPMVDKLVVGFKDEAEEILDRLIRGSEELDIISIVGMAGLGKTTLAKKVYSNASVGYHFNKRAWCIVSQTVNNKRMLLGLINDLGVDCREDPSRMIEEDLAQIVYKSLKGQRFLIVMDDIWDVSAWDALKMSFPDDDKGSRILFTSRNHKVVSEAKSGCSPFLLNPLSQEESWELLEKKLFIQDGCPNDFVEIGKNIARNCRGLPLAVVLVAGLLKKAIGSLSWWEQVGESLDELIAKEGCTDLLELSYKHLPEVLKPCFLYLGSFLEDEEIRVKKLIQLWISEGFIPKQEIKTLEVIAEEYFMDLVARSLVIVTKRSSTGGIKSCVVHDLLHDFCMAKGEEQKVFKVIGLNEISDMAFSSAHYRVRIQPGCWRSFLGSEPVLPASSVHSILSLHPFFDKTFSKETGFQWEGIKNPNFSHLKFLQVLDLDLNLVVEEFPEGITELILLRYLAMRFYITIPPSIKKLENLETLHLCPPSGRIVFNLPVILLEMRKLRHVNITPVRIPGDLGDDIPSLENVQTCSFVVLYPKYAERFWRKIPNVRKLKCHLEKWGYTHQDLNFDSLCNLESLFVRYAFGYAPYGRPEWLSGVISFPSTLKKLTLMDFRLPWSNMSPIATLPNLEVLKLIDGFQGKTWNVEDDEFPNLKFLKLHRVDIEELNATDGCFPCLEHLVVEYCPSLKKIPSSFESILTLKMIQIAQGAPTLKESAGQIQGEQKELGNDQLEVLFTEKYQDPYRRFFFGHIR